MYYLTYLIACWNFNVLQWMKLRFGDRRNNPVEILSIERSFNHSFRRKSSSRFDFSFA